MSNKMNIEYYICHDGEGNLDIVKAIGLNNYSIIYKEILGDFIFIHPDKYE